MSFQHCSNWVINDGQFTNVQGSQVTVHGDWVQFVRQEAQELTVWDDYKKIRTGAVYATKLIGETPVRRLIETAPNTEEYKVWKNVEARRNITYVNRVPGEDRETEFLHVAYKGPDAFKAFKQDFERFSGIKDPRIAQLFGYNDNERGLPALVFYDALIPLSHILIAPDKLSPVLYTYLAHQFCIMRKATSSGRLALGDIWVEPRSGELRKGPYVQNPSFTSWMMDSVGEKETQDHNPGPLPIQAYGDSNTIFDYLTRIVTTGTILQGMCWSHRGLWEDLADEVAISMLPLVSGAVYNWRSREVVARWTGARERCFCKFHKVQKIPDMMRETLTVMEDNSVRFTVTLADMQCLQEFDLQYVLSREDERLTLVESWLSQAHSVFSQLGLHEGEWEDYCTLNSFFVRLRCREEYLSGQEADAPPRVFLFIRPIPRPSDAEEVWRCWMESPKYFWSLEPSGAEMSDNEQRSLNLPSFTSTIHVLHLGWYCSHYKAIQKLHTYKGFPPATKDLARFLGFPVFDVVAENHRFQELDISTDTEVKCEEHPETQDLPSCIPDTRNASLIGVLSGQTSSSPLTLEGRDQPPVESSRAKDRRKRRRPAHDDIDNRPTKKRRMNAE